MNAENGVSFKRKESFLNKVNFSSLCILINEGGDHGKVINAAGWADCLVGCACKEPFILLNVDCFAISNSPPYALPKLLQGYLDTPPSIRGIAAQLGIWTSENKKYLALYILEIRESGLVRSLHACLASMAKLKA